ncbi:hypothetical protein QYE76_037348 [Lolium multiflorum]|uniref:Ribonuclease H1 N-terminal domain-containing protein n=1 Tax=Lolium multiflorum TaxID=4521 RepID=A0AAD8VCP6_LOLMU|nr:hypothetical protein QYE76_037348 [Lolium multiflorum]
MGYSYVFTSCSKKLFDSQETAEEENPEEVAAAAVKKMLSPNTLRATVTAVGDGPVLQPKKRKRANKKDDKDKAAAKDKDKLPSLRGEGANCMNFVEKYPADLCFIRFNDIFDIYRMQMLHFECGRVPGVYDDWEDCRRQVHRFSGNSYKGYPTRVEAEGRYAVI